MTADRAPFAGPLARRMLAAFVLVALSSVVVLTLAALVATDQGLASARRGERQQAADRVAAASAAAYTDAGSWPHADLTAAATAAQAVDARLVVRDSTGAMVSPGRGMGTGMGPQLCKYRPGYRAE